MTCSWVRGSFRERDGGRGFWRCCSVNKGIWQVAARDTWSCSLGILALSWDAGRYPCHELLAIVLSGIPYWEKCQWLSGTQNIILV